MSIEVLHLPFFHNLHACVSGVTKILNSKVKPLTNVNGSRGIFPSRKVSRTMALKHSFLGKLDGSIRLKENPGGTTEHQFLRGISHTDGHDK